MTAVAMGKGTVDGIEGCPKVLNVTLAGATSSSWATDAIVKIATAIKTDSDGYKITLEMSGNNSNTAIDKYMGGCLAVGTTNPIVCFYSKSVDAKTPASANGRQYSAMYPTYTAAKNFGATAITGTTAITAAKWYMQMGSSNNCSAVLTAASSVETATCRVTSFARNLATATSASWFQPKEISTKVYTTLTRFSAKESATWTGMTDAGIKASAGCTAKTLTGASALVAGAAVAFSAAALAF